MCIETNIKNAECYIRKGLHITALSYIDRVKEQLYHMSEKDKKVIEHKYKHFIQKYIKPLGTDGVYEND